MNATTEAAPDLVAPLKTEQDLQRIVDQVDAVVADLRKALGLRPLKAKEPRAQRHQKN